MSNVGTRDAFEAKGISHKVISNEGGNFTSGQSICCATCGRVEIVTTNTFAHRMPPEVLEKKFKRKGWELAHGVWQCPDHAKRKAKTKEPAISVRPITREVVPLVAAPPPPSLPKETELNNLKPPLLKLADLGEATKPDRAAHRRIFSALLGVWDETKGRYMTGEGDGKLATELSMPRAWIEAVRKDSFGDDGGSDDMDELAENLAAAEARYKKAADEALTLASRISDMAAEVGAFRKSLERIKTATGHR
jgi:hypothetical protein